MIQTISAHALTDISLFNVPSKQIIAIGDIQGVLQLFIVSNLLLILKIILKFYTKLIFNCLNLVNKTKNLNCCIYLFIIKNKNIIFFIFTIIKYKIIKF